MTHYPTPPFPTIGEILYEIATVGGLVSTSNDKDPLYNNLKGFKDDRKRPGFPPKQLMYSVLPDIENRLASIWEMDNQKDTTSLIAMVGTGIISWFDLYSELVAKTNASFLTRDVMVKDILWPTYFSVGIVMALETLNTFRPFASLDELASAENPLGWYLNLLSSNGTSDFNQIAQFRAKKYDIDETNARQTVDTWLNGTVPNLANCYDALEALNLKNDLGKKFGIFFARILQKMPLEYRQHIRHRLTLKTETTNYRDAARSLIKELSHKVISQLTIGQDRPYAKIETALYEIQPNRPSRLELINMLERQERTWEPIKDQTMHLIHGLWARFHALSGEGEKALERYILAYNFGANRDSCVYRVTIQEALILAAKLGKKKHVTRFSDWLGFYFRSDWDEEKQSIEERFEEVFPTALRFDLKQG